MYSVACNRVQECNSPLRAFDKRIHATIQFALRCCAHQCTVASTPASTLRTIHEPLTCTDALNRACSVACITDIIEYRVLHGCLQRCAPSGRARPRRMNSRESIRALNSCIGIHPPPLAEFTGEVRPGLPDWIGLRVCVVAIDAAGLDGSLRVCSVDDRARIAGLGIRSYACIVATNHR